jgi:hypothetical protein
MIVSTDQAGKKDSGGFLEGKKSRTSEGSMKPKECNESPEGMNGTVSVEKRRKSEKRRRSWENGDDKARDGWRRRRREE